MASRRDEREREFGAGHRDDVTVSPRRYAGLESDKKRLLYRQLR